MHFTKWAWVQVRLPLLLVLGAACVAFFTVFGGVKGGLLVLAGIVGISVVLLIMNRFTWGFYLLFFLSIFMFYVQRLAGVNIPFGVLYDFLAVLTFFAMVFTYKNKLDWSTLLHPITWGFVILIAYHLIEILNPMGTTLAWAVSLRREILFIMYLVCLQVLMTENGVKKITYIVIGLSFLVALYGMWQEFFGLSHAEQVWLHSDPARYKLYFIWGRMRKFSFLSDPSAYGIFLGFGGLCTLILAIRARQFSKKLLLGIMAGIILVAMNFSGTRTAYVMISVGMVFYILMTMRSPKTMAIVMSLAICILLIFFGPFHGWQINRIRSAFQPSEDASMGVRDMKRMHYQPFVQTHPFGGGVYTTTSYGKSFAPGHEFAGFDPDSGYLETAMESGWIGLILLLVFVSIAMCCGINAYFSMQDPYLKTVLLTYLSGFFALSVAHYAQNAMYNKPMDLMVVVSLGMIAQIPYLDKKLKEKVR